MHYECSVCGDDVEGDLLLFMDHTQEHIVDEIKKKHPEWVENDGVCKKCLEYFKTQLKGQE